MAFGASLKRLRSIGLLALIVTLILQVAVPSQTVFAIQYDDIPAYQDELPVVEETDSQSSEVEAENEEEATQAATLPTDELLSGAGDEDELANDSDIAEEKISQSKEFDMRSADNIIRQGAFTTFTWTLDDAGVLEISGSGALPANAFRANYASAAVPESVLPKTEVTSVVITDGVTGIGMNCFNACATIQEVSIGDTVSSISSSAFVGCGELRHVDFGASLKTISSGAFSGCAKLTGVVFPVGITSVQGTAFKGTGITQLIIPGTMKTMTLDAFQDCKSLTSVEIQSGVETVSGFQGCSSLNTISWPDTLKVVDNSAFKNCSGLTADIQFSSNVTKIGTSAFLGTNIQAVYLASSTVFEYALATGSFAISTKLYIDGVLLEMDDGLSPITRMLGYSYDSEAKELTIAGKGSFKNTDFAAALAGKVDINDITTITFTEGITSIPMLLFTSATNSKLEVVNIASSIASIETSAFNKCANLRSVVIAPESSLSSIGGSAFAGCANLSGTLDLRDTKIQILSAAAIFNNTNLSEVLLPDSLEEIGATSFSGMALTHMVLPPGVKRITGTPFSANKQALTDIYCPATVETIAAGVLSDATQASIIIYGTASEIASFDMEKISNLSNSPSATLFREYQPSDDYVFELELGVPPVTQDMPFEDELIGRKISYQANISSVNKESSEYTDLKASLDGLEDVLLARNITVNDHNGIAIAETPRTFNITMPLGTSEYDGKTVSVWQRGSEDDEAVKLPSAYTVEGGAVTFSTTTFGSFFVTASKEFTVVFDSQGGSGVAPQAVLIGSRVSRPSSDPTKGGYEFTGWFSDAQCTLSYDFNSPVTSSFTLYAGWKPSLSGGSGTDTSGSGSSSGSGTSTGTGTGTGTGATGDSGFILAAADGTGSEQETTAQVASGLPASPLGSSTSSSAAGKDSTATPGSDSVAIGDTRTPESGDAPWPVAVPVAIVIVIVAALAALFFSMRKRKVIKG